MQPARERDGSSQSIGLIKFIGLGIGMRYQVSFTYQWRKSRLLGELFILVPKIYKAMELFGSVASEWDEDLDVGMGQMHNSAITVRFLIRARRGGSHV